MFKNKPDKPLGPEIVATTPNGTPTATKIRMGMKSSSVCTRKKLRKDAGDSMPRAYTTNAARRAMILIARILEVAAHVLGDHLNPKSLLAALLRIDSLNASERTEIIEALGPDVDVFRSFLSEEILKVLNSPRLQPRLLAPHLKAILRGPLGAACWGEDVTERQMANAVTSNLLLMGSGLLRGAKAAKGVVMWGSSYERESRAGVDQREESEKQAPSLARAFWPRTEERSIWATR